jgi:predicted enzyme related to lactoylglutathione lyase
VKGNVMYMEFPSEDIDRAQRFWSGVLGWEFGSGLTEEFDYRMAQTGPDAGVALTPGDKRGHPNVYIETADLDAALSKVQELGGEVGEIHVVPDRLAAEDTVVIRPWALRNMQGQRGERVSSVSTRRESPVTSSSRGGAYPGLATDWSTRWSTSAVA